MSVNALGTAASGMRSEQFRVDTAANNIANVNTDGFRSRTARSADLGYINDIGRGARIASTNYAAGPRPSAGAAVADGGTGAAAAEPGARSDSDPVREITNMAAAQTAYAANAAAGRTADDMARTVIDMKA